MELRVLKYFIKIVEEENMTKAAQKLHVSQPALSKQMKELENEIGHLLFVRNKQRMVLTEKGMLLKKRAESILMLVDKTVDELNNDELLVGNIYIGTGQTDNLDEIMEIIKQFRNHYPFVKFHIHSGFSFFFVFLVFTFTRWRFQVLKYSTILDDWQASFLTILD